MFLPLKVPILISNYEGFKVTNDKFIANFDYLLFDVDFIS